MMRSRRFLLALLCLPLLLPAQEANYAAAEQYDIPNLRSRVGSLTILPFFIGNSNQCWFSFEDSQGKIFYYIDPEKKEKRLFYDKRSIITRLQQLRKEKIDTAALVLPAPFISKANDQAISITYKGTQYAYNFYRRSLVAETKRKQQVFWDNRITGTPSPDKKWQLYARAHNLYLQQVGDTLETALSADAQQYYSFCVNESDTSVTRNMASNAIWFPDSGTFYTLRTDNRKVGTMSVMHTVGLSRPWLETYKYQFPGDQYVTQYELYVGNVTTRKLVKIQADKWKDQELEVVKTGRVLNNEIYFLRKKRTRDEIELCAGNITTGQVRVIIHEVSRPYINDELFNVSVLNDGERILWWSDRTGWGHYYLYDGNGKLLHAVTQGNWTAGKIIRTDTAGQTLYLYGYGKEAGRNPYYAHVYKVNLDGQTPKLLTPENATHSVYFSPTCQYFIDNYSTINTVPNTVLRNNNGGFVMEVAKPDVQKLFDYGWRPPEPFTVKAADGVTDLYGIMWKPFDFDSTKKYPVISQVYPGPFTETVWTDFTVFDKYNNAPLAQVGFIVVCMGHRGGSPFRDKQYAMYQYGNLRDAPLADDKYGLEQLAQRYHYIDISRVGIFGHSGGAMMATAAICTYPDLYKVAVASSGNHDNNIYNRTWGETYQGIREIVDSSAKGPDKVAFRFTTDINQSLAKNLEGHLLLVTGEVDANVHPGHTYRMADALIRAGKDFDLLVLPGQSHHYEGVYKSYFENRLRHYFAKYLIEENGGIIKNQK